MASPTTDGLDLSPTDVSNLSVTKMSSSHLLSLPRETRDEVIAHLLRAGDLAILRTSKQVYHEARERLYHEGVFRCKMGFYDTGSSLPKDWMSFRNFYFHMFVGPGTSVSSFAFLRPGYLELLPEATLRRECRILFDFGIVDQDHFNKLVFKCVLWRLGLAFLVVFTTVVITVVPEQSEAWGGESSLRETWRIVKWFLEPALGPAESVRGTDKEKGPLVFHPQRLGKGLTRTWETIEHMWLNLDRR